MSKTHIEFDETDVARILKKIICGDNRDEMVRLMTPIICDEPYAVELLAKLFIGHTLPKVIPNGSLCRVKYDDLGYVSQSKIVLFKDNCDNEQLIGIVDGFKGYHRDLYKVVFKLKDSNGNITEEYMHVRSENIEVIKEL